MSTFGLFSPRRLQRLVSSDANNIARDPMLLVASVMSLLPALVFWLCREPLDEAARAAFGVASISVYVAPVALLLPATLIGWVTGFLLLEDRDEGTLLALDVTPIGKTGFLAYRVAVTAALTSAVTLYGCLLVLPGVSVVVVLAIVAIVATTAVASAVVLPAVAGNKVEGLALTKLTSLLAIVPLLAAVPSPLRYVAGIVPGYWLGEILHLTEVAAAPLWLAATLGIAVNLMVIRGLFLLLNRRAG